MSLSDAERINEEKVNKAGIYVHNRGKKCNGVRGTAKGKIWRKNDGKCDKNQLVSRLEEMAPKDRKLVQTITSEEKKMWEYGGKEQKK